jgi:hypothetical protein
MPRDEQVIRSLDPDHFHSQQNGTNNDRMHAVDPDDVHSLQPGQRVAVLGHEARISAQVCYGATRFHASENIPPSKVLVFDRNRRLTLNAGALQVLQRDGRQSQTLPGHDFLLV